MTHIIYQPGCCDDSTTIFANDLSDKTSTKITSTKSIRFNERVKIRYIPSRIDIENEIALPSNPETTRVKKGPLNVKPIVDKLPEIISKAALPSFSNSRNIVRKLKTPPAKLLENGSVNSMNSYIKSNNPNSYIKSNNPKELRLGLFGSRFSSFSMS